MSIFKKKPIFNEAQNKELVEAIQDAEKKTSGEVRIYIEHKCKFIDPMERAQELFQALEMQKTKQHNAVLVYVALKDRQFAILGDEGIHQKVGDHFWRKQATQMRQDFKNGAYINGIATAVRSIGDSLTAYFPHEADGENELPDDIIYGR